MSPITRRGILSGAAAAPAFALQSSSSSTQRSSDVRDNGAPPKRRMLASAWSPESLRKVLLPRTQWHPYPTAAERGGWAALPAGMFDRAVKGATDHLNTPYPPLPATLYLEYVRNGNRSHFEAVNQARRRQLVEAVLAECAEGKGRFNDSIADGVWTICEESTWVLPAHLSAQKRGSGLADPTEYVIDLFSAETAAMMAWIDYLVGPNLEKVNPLVRDRLRFELERRILVPYRERNDFWWMGLEADRPVNNWNPWINSNCLTCILLLEKDEQRRAQGVYKVLESVDRFLDAYHDDGGCDEGPSYWGRAGASLFDNLELLDSASKGAINFYSKPLIREIGKYIYRAHVAGSWFVNFADAGAKLHPDGDLIYRYGKAIGDPDMQAFGALFGKTASAGGESLGRALPAIFNAAEIQKAEAHAPLVRDVWLPGVGVSAARVKAGSADGFYFAAQGGHNAESHNHNDVGNFIVFLDGEPVLIDVGVETYSAKTFSSRRYEIWTMQSAYHNLPTINGVQQAAGRRYEARNTAFKTDDSGAEFGLNIEAAYPADAGLDRWRRTIRLDRRGGSVQVADSYALKAGSGRIELSLMCAKPVRVDGSVLAVAGGVRIEVSGPSAPEFKVEECPTTDARLRAVWGEKIYRVLAAWGSAPGKGELVMRVRRA
jgi:hypothetical protein